MRLCLQSLLTVIIKCVLCLICLKLHLIQMNMELHGVLIPCQKQLHSLIKKCPLFMLEIQHYTKKAGADYQDPTGMVLFTSRMQAVYIVPDEICNNLLMATSFYAGNTEKPLAYDFAERFDQEMWKYQFGLGVFSENQLYVRLGTLQDNEGISNALLLRLVGTYAALVLIIICFTILSVQQLTDTIEQKKQFQTISKLGVEQTDCGRYIRQQMIFKFGLPVMVSLIFSIGTILFLTLTGYEEYTVYISLNEMLTIFAVVYAAFIGILISYFVSTYYLFKKHMALS